MVILGRLLVRSARRRRSFVRHSGDSTSNQVHTSCETQPQKVTTFSSNFPDAYWLQRHLEKGNKSYRDMVLLSSGKHLLPCSF